MRVAIIVAMSADGLIGNAQALPWRLSKDLKRFRERTWGKPVIMGRKTFESIGKPLPGRHLIVVTRRTDYAAAGCRIAPSLPAALALAREWAAEHQAEEIMIAGGGEIYREALPLCDRIYLTTVEGRFQGDTYFPAASLGPPGWRIVHQEDGPADEKNPYPHRFAILERKPGIERLPG